LVSRHDDQAIDTLYIGCAHRCPLHPPPPACSARGASGTVGNSSFSSDLTRWTGQAWMHEDCLLRTLDRRRGPEPMP
jgi:hypothetical protein